MEPALAYGTTFGAVGRAVERLVAATTIPEIKTPTPATCTTLDAIPMLRLPSLFSAALMKPPTRGMYSLR
jgi:hypothetical protein